jgi:hypothetical protein
MGVVLSHPHTATSTHYRDPLYKVRVSVCLLVRGVLVRLRFAVLSKHRESERVVYNCALNFRGNYNLMT